MTWLYSLTLIIGLIVDFDFTQWKWVISTNKINQQLKIYLILSYAIVAMLNFSNWDLGLFDQTLTMIGLLILFFLRFIIKAANTRIEITTMSTPINIDSIWLDPKYSIEKINLIPNRYSYNKYQSKQSLNIRTYCTYNN